MSIRVHRFTTIAIAVALGAVGGVTSPGAAPATAAPWRPGCWQRVYAEKHDRCGYLFGQKLTEDEVNCLQRQVFPVTSATAASLRGGAVAAAIVFGVGAANAWYSCVVNPG